MKGQFMLSLKLEKKCKECGKRMRFIRKWKSKTILKLFCSYNSAWGLEEKFICTCGHTTRRSINTQDHLQITPEELRKIYKLKFKGK